MLYMFYICNTVFIVLVLGREQGIWKTSGGYQLIHPSICNYTYVSGTKSQYQVQNVQTNHEYAEQIN